MILGAQIIEKIGVEKLGSILQRSSQLLTSQLLIDRHAYAASHPIHSRAKMVLSEWHSLLDFRTHSKQNVYQSWLNGYRITQWVSVTTLRHFPLPRDSFM